MAFPPGRIFGAPDPIDPHLRRWMLFVDGENLTLRGQALARKRGIVLEPGKLYRPDVFLWLHPANDARRDLSFHLRGLSLRKAAERAFYYTSMTGDQVALESVREALWALGFTAEVFGKPRKEQKGKGVDIALTKDVLSNAFLDNYDVAVLITGDADFEPVISELKRLGKSVCLLAVTEGGANVKPSLRRSADYFLAIDDPLMRLWKKPAEMPSSNTDG